MNEEVKYTSSKPEIWKAYQELLKQKQLKQTGSVDLASEAKAKHEAQVVSTADSIKGENIAVDFANLAKSVSGQFASISASLTEAVEKLNTVEEAIQVRTAHLNELIDFEGEALDLSALVATKLQLGEKLDAENAQKIADAQVQLTQIREDISTARQEWAQELAAAKKQLADEQKKARDEWEYNFKREKQQARDKHEDELAADRRKHEELQLDVNKKLNERADMLTKREQAVADQEAEIADLRAKVSEFPQQLQDAVKEAREEGKKDAGREYGFEKNALKREYEAKEAQYKREIELLKEQLNREQEAHRLVSEKLDKAHERVQHIATSAVESASKQQVHVHNAQPDQLKK